jgi:phosphoglycerate-specific signal transduction histidine kinase
MSPISAAKLGVTGQTVMAMSLSLAQDLSARARELEHAETTHAIG